MQIAEIFLGAWIWMVAIRTRADAYLGTSNLSNRAFSGYFLEDNVTIVMIFSLLPTVYKGIAWFFVFYRFKEF